MQAIIGRVRTYTQYKQLLGESEHIQNKNSNWASQNIFTLKEVFVQARTY